MPWSSYLAVLERQVQEAIDASDEYARRRREVYELAATHGPVPGGVHYREHLALRGLGSGNDRVHPAWAAFLEEARTVLADIVAEQDALWAPLQADLETRGAAAAAEMLHPYVNDAYVAGDLTLEEFERARSLLEQYAPADAALEELTAAREKNAATNAKLRALWGASATDSPSEPRSATDAIAAAETRAWTMTAYQEPLLPHAEGAAEEWLHRRWRELIQP